jgi:hypothetical protein
MSKLLFGMSLYLFGPIMTRLNTYLQYQPRASAYLFEGLNKTIKENQAKKEK